METIYKYKLKLDNVQTIDMPINSKILCVQVQHGKPCVWVEIKAETSMYERRTFRVIGTGFAVIPNESLTYIGTVQTKDGDFIWHVYEVLNNKGENND